MKIHPYYVVFAFGLILIMVIDTVKNGLTYDSWYDIFKMIFVITGLIMVIFIYFKDKKNRIE